MISGPVASRYAKAIYELGSELGTLETLVAEVSRMASAYEVSSDLRAAIANPLVAYEGKRSIVTELADRLGVSAACKNAVLLMNDRRRMPALPAIAKRLREMADAKKGVLRAEVLSASPLSESYLSRLSAQLERMTGQKIAIDARVDPSLLGGVVARIGDRVYDGSLRARLDQMKAALLPN